MSADFELSLVRGTSVNVARMRLGCAVPEGPRGSDLRAFAISEPTMGEVVNASLRFRERKWRARWEEYLSGQVSSDDMIRETLAEPEFADYCKRQYAQERKRRERQDDGA